MIFRTRKILGIGGRMSESVVQVHSGPNQVHILLTRVAWPWEIILGLGVKNKIGQQHNRIN